jgi:D-alanyl-lipoteichoic acid acyltransferase DltB (MBOAT superfamily)
MLFNSYLFIFIFLPLVLFAYLQLENYRKYHWAICWLIFASLFYYGWWKPQFLLLLFASIIANSIFGKILCSYGRLAESYRSAVLATGIAFNLGVLAFFKYADFLVANVDYLFGFEFALPNILLPIGVSFITFQKIAFLVDAYRGQVKQFSLRNFSLFVTFFPQLIAGPIVHHAEIIPQFSRTRDAETRSEDLAVGWSIFCLGLFKKVVVADTCAGYADAGYTLLHSGKLVDTATAWTSVLAYAFQLYYDFSGYSDMAVGLARLFGIRFPANFNSPYKSTGIIEFWRRWHISLSRFLRDYLYFPLGGNRYGSVRRYVNLMIVMVLGGLWHGANWTFPIWGAIHGAMLIVNHAWRNLSVSQASVFNTRIMHAVFVGLTFFAVTFAWIPFRSSTLAEARQMFSSMFAIPLDWSSTRQLLVQIVGLGGAVLWLTIVAVATWTLPNSYQIFKRFNPVNNLSREQLSGVWAIDKLDFKVTAILAAMFVLSVLHLSHVSPFLYFQF